MCDCVYIMHLDSGLTTLNNSLLFGEIKSSLQDVRYKSRGPNWLQRELIVPSEPSKAGVGEDLGRSALDLHH